MINEKWGAMRPCAMNNKGIVDEYIRPKLSYFVVKELFGKVTLKYSGRLLVYLKSTAARYP